MTPKQDFENDTLARMAEGVSAVYHSDAAPYLALLSEREPVSLFGALGPREVEQTGFRNASSGSPLGSATAA